MPPVSPSVSCAPRGVRTPWRSTKRGSAGGKLHVPSANRHTSGCMIRQEAVASSRSKHQKPPAPSAQTWFLILAQSPTLVDMSSLRSHQARVERPGGTHFAHHFLAGFWVDVLWEQWHAECTAGLQGSTATAASGSLCDHTVVVGGTLKMPQELLMEPV